MKISIDITEPLEELIVTEVNGVLEVQCSGVFCWRCGSSGKMSMHHTLPKHLKPMKNVVIPVCFSCHEDINHSDIKGVKAFGYKIYKSAKTLSKMIGLWTERSESMLKRENDGRT